MRGETEDSRGEAVMRETIDVMRFRMTGRRCTAGT